MKQTMYELFFWNGKSKESCGFFPTEEAAHEYADNNKKRIQDDYYIVNTDTQEAVIPLYFSSDEYAKLLQAAEIKGLDVQEFITLVMEEFLMNKKAGTPKPAVKQIWKFKDDPSALYIVSTMSISHCRYYTLVGINSGDVGPLWNNLEEITEDMEFVANDINEIIKDYVL